MRILLAVLGVILCVGMMVGGAVAAFVGFLDQSSADRFYDVAFETVGDDCGPEQLELNVTDGLPLACVPSGMVPVSEPDGLQGFTEKQNRKVLTTAREYGHQGLDAYEQRRIQGLVDRFAESMPPEKRRIPVGANPQLWGARLGWLGVGVAAVGAIGYAAITVAGRR